MEETGEGSRWRSRLANGPKVLEDAEQDYEHLRILFLGWLVSLSLAVGCLFFSPSWKVQCSSNAVVVRQGSEPIREEDDKRHALSNSPRHQLVFALGCDPRDVAGQGMFDVLDEDILFGPLTVLYHLHFSPVVVKSHDRVCGEGVGPSVGRRSSFRFQQLRAS